VLINDREWPIVRVDYSGPLLIADHEALATAINSYLTRDERFVLLFASRPSGRGEPGTAKAQLSWLESNREQLGRLVAGWAMVVSAAEKASMDSGRGGGIRARMPFPQRHFTALEEASAWAHGQLDDRAEQ
jgi:hypothetical protein